MLLGTTRPSAAAAPRAWIRERVPLLSASQAWEVAAVQEPSVLYDGGTWKMWYTGDWDSAAMGYATCSGDPTVTANWTKYGSNPVLGQGGSSVAGYVSGNNVTKIASTYYAFYYDASGGGNLKVSTSSDGIAWGTPAVALAASGDVTGWANSYIWNEGGSTWKGLVEGRTTDASTPWATYTMTSTDGLAWTVGARQTSLKVGSELNYGGMWVANLGVKIDGEYHLWYHAGTGNFTNIYYATSPTLANDWTIHSEWGLNANLGTYEKQQVADACVIEQGGNTYLFYDGVNNPTETSYINVAMQNRTLAEIVA